MRQRTVGNDSEIIGPSNGEVELPFMEVGSRGGAGAGSKGRIGGVSGQVRSRRAQPGEFDAGVPWHKTVFDMGPWVVMMCHVGLSTVTNVPFR